MRPGFVDAGGGVDSKTIGNAIERAVMCGNWDEGVAFWGDSDMLWSPLL